MSFALSMKWLPTDCNKSKKEPMFCREISSKEAGYVVTPTVTWIDASLQSFSLQSCSDPGMGFLYIGDFCPVTQIIWWRHKQVNENQFSKSFTNLWPIVKSMCSICWMGILTYNHANNKVLNKGLMLCIQQNSRGWVQATLYRETLASLLFISTDIHEPSCTPFIVLYRCLFLLQCNINKSQAHKHIILLFTLPPIIH